MKLIIHSVPNDHATIITLAQLYLYELSDIEARDISDDGQFQHAMIQDGVLRLGIQPFLIHADAQLIGFILLSQQSRLRSQFSGHTIESIFILRRYRRNSLGRNSACQIFDRLPGAWEVATHGQNVRGMAFWRSVIDVYTNGTYQETWLQDSHWRGTVHSFEAPCAHYE